MKKYPQISVLSSAEPAEAAIAPMYVGVNRFTGLTRALTLAAVLSGGATTSGCLIGGEDGWNQREYDNNLIGALDGIIDEAEDRNLNISTARANYELAQSQVDEAELDVFMDQIIVSLSQLVTIAESAGYNLESLDDLDEINDTFLKNSKYEKLMEFMAEFEEILSNPPVTVAPIEDGSGDGSVPSVNPGAGQDTDPEEVTDPTRDNLRPRDTVDGDMTWHVVALEGMDMVGDGIAYFPLLAEEAVRDTIGVVADWANETDEERNRIIADMSAAHATVVGLCRRHIGSRTTSDEARSIGANMYPNPDHINSLITVCAAVAEPATCRDGACTSFVEPTFFDALKLDQIVPAPTAGSGLVNPFDNNDDEPTSPSRRSAYDQVIRNYCETEVTPAVIGQFNDLPSRAGTALGAIPGIGYELTRISGWESGLLLPHPLLTQQDLVLAEQYANEVCFEALSDTDPNIPGYYTTPLEALTGCREIATDVMSSWKIDNGIRSFNGVDVDDAAVVAARAAAVEQIQNLCMEVSVVSTERGSTFSHVRPIGANTHARSRAHCDDIFADRIAEVVHPGLGVDLGGVADSIAAACNNVIVVAGNQNRADQVRTRESNRPQLQGDWHGTRR